MLDSEAKQENVPHDFSTRVQKADRMGVMLVTIPKWIAWAVIAWQIRLSIEVLVGRYAFPSLLSRSWRQASIWEVVCWIAGMLGLAYGIYNRRLIKRRTAQDLSRLELIERHLNTFVKGVDMHAAAGERNPT
jgi:hypothetical protein